MRRLAEPELIAGRTCGCLANAFILVGSWFVGALFVQDHFANNTYQLLINTGRS
ncbi:MAG TPA: hypothetical protein VGJ03_04910 [Acidimicrobiales bacterium]